MLRPGKFDNANNNALSGENVASLDKFRGEAIFLRHRSNTKQ
jgi:hypothetical protein